MSDTDTDPDDEGELGALQSLRSPRVELLNTLEMTPRRHEARRLAAAMREVIDALVATTATVEELSDASASVETLAGHLRSLPAGNPYRGFAEAAMSGSEMDGIRAGDPEWFEYFDHSPFIGLANPLSPPTFLEYETDRVHGRVTFGSAYEGPPGCVHGGYIAGVFDELLGATQSLSGSQGMTAHLEVDYRRPTPLHVPLELIGRFDRRDGRKIYTTGEIRVNDEVTAQATGLFIQMGPGTFQGLIDSRDR